MRRWRSPRPSDRVRLTSAVTLLSLAPATVIAKLEGLKLSPGPVQAGGPRRRLAGRGGAALRRAARHADVWMPYMVTPEMFGDGLASVRGAAAEYGRDPTQIDGAIYGFFSVHSDGDVARRRALAEEVAPAVRTPTADTRT